MPDSPAEKPIVRRAVLTLDPEMHRRIVEVLWYVENREWMIDPDMFRIDLKKVEALKLLFRTDADVPCTRVSMTHDDAWWLENFVFAAQAYSHRRGEAGLLNVSDAHMAELVDWVARAERWFITPLEKDE